VPCCEKRAFLKEEADLSAILHHNQNHGYEPESPVTRAIEQVFESAGENASVYTCRDYFGQPWKGFWSHA